METQHSGRSSFSGKLGFVLSAAGASVGLGNIWRFPYLAAKYGGGIFLLIYILLAVTFGYTMIMAETALGRMTRKSPVGAFAASGKGRWRAFGLSSIWWGILPVMAVSWHRMGIFPLSSPMALRWKSYSCSLPCLHWASFLPVSAMVWSVFPG